MTASKSEVEYFPCERQSEFRTMNDEDISQVVSLMSLNLTPETCSAKSDGGCDGKKRTAPIKHQRHRRNHTSNCVPSPSIKRPRSHRRTITFSGDEPNFFLKSDVTLNSCEDLNASSKVFDFRLDDVSR